MTHGHHYTFTWGFIVNEHNIKTLFAPFFFLLLSLTKLNYSFEKGTPDFAAISHETGKNNKDGYLPPHLTSL